MSIPACPWHITIIHQTFRNFNLTRLIDTLENIFLQIFQAEKNFLERHARYQGFRWQLIPETTEKISRYLWSIARREFPLHSFIGIADVQTRLSIEGKLWKTTFVNICHVFKHTWSASETVSHAVRTEHAHIGTGLPGACNWKMSNSVLRKKKWILYYINFDGLKKDQPLNKFSEISWPTNFKKGQICLFFLPRKGQTWQLCMIGSARRDTDMAKQLEQQSNWWLGKVLAPMQGAAASWEICDLLAGDNNKKITSSLDSLNRLSICHGVDADVYTMCCLANMSYRSCVFLFLTRCRLDASLNTGKKGNLMAAGGLRDFFFCFTGLRSAIFQDEFPKWSNQLSPRGSVSSNCHLPPVSFT